MTISYKLNPYLFLGFGITCGFLFPVSASAQTFSEILGRPEDHSITMNVLSDKTVEIFYEYGTRNGDYPFSVTPSTLPSNVPLEIKFPGLNSGTRYFYRNRYRLPGESGYKSGPERTFVTQPAPGSTFRFVVETDPHPYDKKCYPPLWNIALQNQLNDNPDFMIDMGDTFGDDHNPFTITSKEIQALHLGTREYFSKICHSVPFFFCQGNHEGESGYYLLQTPPDNLAVWETLWRKLYWPNPYPDDFYTGNTREEGNGIGLPEDYYAWEWGDALFIVLDAYRFYTASAKPGKWDWTIGKIQYDWLKMTLEKSMAKFRFVFIHHLLGEARGAVKLANLYEWGGYDQKGTTWEFTANRPGWAMPIHQLLVKNKVSVLFQGHDHLYAREELDGLVYQTVPMPSDSSYSLGMTANADAFGGIKLYGSGHIRVTVSPEKATVDFVSAVLPKDENKNLKNGSVLYSYVVLPSVETNSSGLIKKESPGIRLSVHPNPFFRQTEINFTLQQASRTEISIADFSGRMVYRIDPGILKAGYHSIIWSITTVNDQLIPPGMYICTVRTDHEIFSAKMIFYAT